MSDILKKYEEATTPTVVDARSQADGKHAVDWINSEYQDNFTVREKGDTVRNGPGNFTDKALEHYDQEVTELANSHHKYNSSNTDSYYVNKHLNAAGTIYQSTTEK